MKYFFLFDIMLQEKLYNSSILFERIGEIMKKIGSVIVILYVIVAIFVTICLLSYNKYKVTQFGDKTLVIIDHDVENLKYKDGDLVIVGSEGYENAEAGDTVFFYKDGEIKIAEILKNNNYGEAGVTFTIDGNYQVVHEDVIGTSNNEKVMSGLGKVLGILESKWGFLFIVVFPTMLAFLREVKELVVELRNNKAKE